MSRVIKASQIIGEYKLNDIGLEQIVDNNSRENGKDDEQNIDDSDKLKEMRKAKINAEKKLAEVKDEAEEIIAQAREEAETIKNKAQIQAENELELAQQKGYEEGFKRGKDEGYQSGLSQLNDSLVALKNVIENVKNDFNQKKEELPDEVIKLATKISSRMINVKLKENPEIINNIVTEMIKDIDYSHGKILIKLNPESINHLNQSQVEKSLPGQDVEFVADNSLIAGDCIVETDFGGKDGTIANKLDVLEKELLKGAT